MSIPALLSYTIFSILVTNQNFSQMGWTPLMIACSAGRLEVVRYLISLPAVDVNVANNNQQTALHYAASKNRPQVIFMWYICLSIYHVPDSTPSILERRRQLSVSCCAFTNSKYR